MRFIIFKSVKNVRKFTILHDLFLSQINQEKLKEKIIH